jgi:hypothetical protein
MTPQLQLRTTETRRTTEATRRENTFCSDMMTLLRPFSHIILFQEGAWVIEHHTSQISEKAIGAAIEVHRQLGRGTSLISSSNTLSLSKSNRWRSFSRGIKRILR